LKLVLGKIHYIGQLVPNKKRKGWNFLVWWIKLEKIKDEGGRMKKEENK